MIEIDLKGKRGLVMGVADARSLGWAIAERLHAAGAELAFSYKAPTSTTSQAGARAPAPGAAGRRRGRGPG